MGWTGIGFEGLKLAAQFAGALAVARLTVRWALGRYKSEKTWERRLAAYADLVAAVSEWKLVVGQWFDCETSHTSLTGSAIRELNERRASAKRRFEEAAATGRLLLPQATVNRLDEVTAELARASRLATSLPDGLDDEWGILNAALVDLINQGRTALNIEEVQPRYVGQPDCTGQPSPENRDT